MKQFTHYDDTSTMFTVTLLRDISNKDRNQQIFINDKTFMIILLPA